MNKSDQTSAENYGYIPFRDIVAVMTAYNEADVIACAIEHLVAQGIGVYLIDNWSTDDTVEQAMPYKGRGLLGVEKFPKEGPSPYFSLGKLLRRVEIVHHKIGARWCIHQDADEVRSSPWPNVSLPEALKKVEREGYNTVNHFCLLFRPVDNNFRPYTDMEKHFKHFELGSSPGHFMQKKMWLNPGVEVELHQSGGHSVRFAGQRVFPVPFLLKHYPIRSQAHGERKILRERKARFDPQERAQGWHVQYDSINEATSFIADKHGLKLFDECATKEHFLANPPKYSAKPVTQTETPRVSL